MSLFQFNWTTAWKDPFVVEAKDEIDAIGVFHIEWARFIDKIRAYPQNVGKENEFETSGQMLESGYSIRVVGDPTIKWNPRPTCCDEIDKGPKYDYDEKGPHIRLRTYRLSSPPNNWEDILSPHWTMRAASIEVYFCPFCGTKLPEVELLDHPPHPIWTSEMDGDYCGTCSERSMCCKCNPPSTAYRIK